jgi:hypothetical protein
MRSPDLSALLVSQILDLQMRQSDEDESEGCDANKSRQSHGKLLNQ